MVSTGPPEGHRANWYRFPEIRTSRLRAVCRNGRRGVTGLTEFEAWGRGTLPVAPAPSPPGNLAKGAKVTASFTSRFDKVEEVNDGVVAFTPEPRNRWTAYESPNAEDWLALDLGEPREIGRVDLMLYDDGGGVRAPKSYRLQTWDGFGLAGRARSRPSTPRSRPGAS